MFLPRKPVVILLFPQTLAHTDYSINAWEGYCHSLSYHPTKFSITAKVLKLSKRKNSFGYSLVARQFKNPA